MQWKNEVLIGNLKYILVWFNFSSNIIPITFANVFGTLRLKGFLEN